MNDVELDSPYTDEEIEAFRPEVVRDLLRQAQDENAKQGLIIGHLLHQIEDKGNEIDRLRAAMTLAMDELVNGFDGKGPERCYKVLEEALKESGR